MTEYTAAFAFDQALNKGSAEVGSGAAVAPDFAINSLSKSSILKTFSTPTIGSSANASGNLGGGLDNSGGLYDVSNHHENGHIWSQERLWAPREKIMNAKRKLRGVHPSDILLRGAFLEYLIFSFIPGCMFILRFVGM